MTTFERWLKNRSRPGTFEYMVRHARGGKYLLSIATFRVLLIAEMFVGSGGNLAKLSEECGIHCNSISRLLRLAGFDKDKLREMASQEKPK